MFAKVILASVGQQAPPIYTLHLRYPRIIHAEVKTHRVLSIDSVLRDDVLDTLDIMSDRDLSRNARSSRAVPVQTMLDEIKSAPFVPWHWGKNQRGMQAGAECDEVVALHWDGVMSRQDREGAWLIARDNALDAAKGFMEAGYHKQIVNRLLEPFMWIDTLVTSTEWSNFLWLRDHEAAEPHLRDLAVMVKEAIDGAQPELLAPGDWHMPYITDDERNKADKGECQKLKNDLLRKISAARCARISYKPFDGNSTWKAELERYALLVGSDRVHASPVEHQATPDVFNTGRELCQFPPDTGWENPELHGNFTGWIQNRKTIPGENHSG